MVYPWGGVVDFGNDFFYRLQILWIFEFTIIRDYDAEWDTKFAFEFRLTTLFAFKWAIIYTNEHFTLFYGDVIDFCIGRWYIRIFLNTLSKSFHLKYHEKRYGSLENFRGAHWIHSYYKNKHKALYI
ncbi:MAG: hypothetical protein ACXAAH_01590 [Promethearchaeota archaeon]